MSKTHCTATADASGWRFELTRRSGLLFAREERLSLADWPAVAADHPGAALLLSLLDTEDAQPEGDHALRLTHAAVAALTSSEAARIGLPPSAPLTLMLSHEAPIGDRDFALRVEWFQRDGTPLFSARRTGTLIAVGTRQFLIPDPLYSALEAIDAVNAASGDPSPDGLDRRMVAYAHFQERLNRLTGDVHASDYLRGLTIHHATGLGIDLEPGDAAAPFQPTLYGDCPRDPVAAENEELEPIREPLLPRQDAERFRQRFGAQGARGHFTLGTGVYTVLDPPVTAALDVLARVNRADAATRRAFRQDPLSFLTPAIEAAGGDGGILCDLHGYGERVVGIDDWVPPKLSVPLAVAREWFPDEEIERFTIALPDEAPLVIRGEALADLQERIEQSLASGAATCEIDGRAVPLSVPLVETLRGLTARLRPPPPSEPAPAAPDATPAESAARQRKAAVTLDNEEWLSFTLERRAHRHSAEPSLPRALKTAPKPHQESGLAWLQAGYRAGAPGLLLADDMGLGKTYQVLAFLRWLREAHAGKTPKQGPILIVAPKTLLGNWREEIAQHLDADALGAELHVFEQDLKALKIIRASSNDTWLGRQTLDVERIERTDCVLTTYETLRDYHLSFGKVRFAVIVYDEAQKLKNPASLMNRGAKAQQGDFTLLMTGTPIENSVGDLWTLLDLAWPGFLGLSLIEFLKRHRNEDPETREALKRRLIEPTRRPDLGLDIPPILLRRFKQDLLEGLPPRTVEAPREPMPPAQQAAYDAIRLAIRAQGCGALEGLQQLRAVSLHPHLAQPPASERDDAAFIAASARFRLLFQILDRIRAQREKALIFVDLREAQRALYDLIRRRYRLPAPQPETINGATAAPARDRIRAEFQKRPGFDVLILGPKAAGFGLTLTAANHVIHLNRWWNPAVEDQCSDRVYRIGATRPVTIYLPLAIHPELGERSFDTLLHALLEEKRALSREIVVPVQFDDREIRGLFERSLGGTGTDAEADVAAGQFDNLDWRAFERWVAETLKQAGFGVRLSRGQGDGGVDVIGTPPTDGGRAVFIQCKHTSRGNHGRIGEQAVRDLLRARDRYRGQYPDPRLIAVTNGRFARETAALAREHGIELFDAPELATLPDALDRLRNHEHGRRRHPETR